MTGDVSSRRSVKDGRQRCRRINVYANVLEEQPPLCAATRRSLRVTDSRERVDCRGVMGERKFVSPSQCIYFAVWHARSLSSVALLLACCGHIPPLSLAPSSLFLLHVLRPGHLSGFAGPILLRLLLSPGFCFPMVFRGWALQILIYVLSVLCLSFSVLSTLLSHPLE